MKHLLLLSCLFLFSCSKEQVDKAYEAPTGCDSIGFTYNENVRPIFNSNCNFSDCHGAGGRGSYDFTEYAVIANRIRAGTIDYRLDLPFEDPQHMPEKLHLSSCDYFILKTWIKQGFPEK